ncbi:MarR family transcriptional regulator [Streptomyces griseosporeus]|uniref:MarR family transcriptional regulator n=1 Tax=Streptomyces griseosporeus TaxID=1910 RepID=UPI0036F7AD57
MTTTAPAADSRTLALAHYAARAVLESVLSRHGVTFPQNAALRLAALADGPVAREEIADGVAGSLKIGAAEAHRVVDELLAGPFLAADGPSAVRLTAAGREVYDAYSAETREISARIWAGVSPEDRAAAGRVLAHVTERAEAELAARP